ncbi:mechanosensitive ion channel family protein [Promineifilum sp.]|uniref:mechanosensitive ion channel family protein n=1 Tax=Promineifilum sp. TaxID=2664178 RepID=UPI0035B09D72
MLETIDYSDLLMRVAVRLGAAVLILLAGGVLARFGRGLVDRLMARLTLMPSMVALFLSLAYYGIWLLAILLALTALGVPIATVTTTAGAVLVVLGLALQQTLQDLAAAVIFLLFKPFEPGDAIQSGNYRGDVEEIQLFSTTLVQSDKTRVYVPNSELRKAGIINFTKRLET